MQPFPSPNPISDPQEKSLTHSTVPFPLLHLRSTFCRDHHRMKPQVRHRRHLQNPWEAGDLRYHFKKMKTHHLNPLSFYLKSGIN